MQGSRFVLHLQASKVTTESLDVSYNQGSADYMTSYKQIPHEISQQTVFL